MKYLSSIFLVSIGFNIFVWSAISTHRSENALNVYFMNVGQGDSALIKLPTQVDILIDGGPNRSVLHPLYEKMSPGDNYIDLLILSHPQLDHFGGFINIIKRFQIGAFVWNGRTGDSDAWKELERELEKQNIPRVILGEGDAIKNGENIFTVLAPDENLMLSKNLNDSSIVGLLESLGAKLLFTGDIGFRVENYLSEKYNLSVDALKIPHHGSKYSSGGEFLLSASPSISVISVGKNKYGHPAKEALARIADHSGSFFTTEDSGTIHLRVKAGTMEVFTTH